MFSDLTISSKNLDSNLGLLCEALLFYSHTNLILGPDSMKTILRFCGYENLIELINSGQLSLKYCDTALGVADYGNNTYIIGSWKSNSHKQSLIVKEAFEEVYGKSIQSNNHSKHLNRIIKQHNYSEPYLALLKRELDVNENLFSALSIISQNQYHKGNTSIRIEEIRPGVYKIETNIENKLIQDAAFLVATGSGFIYDADKFNSGLATNTQISSYTEEKINRISNKTRKEVDQISCFHEFVLPEYYDLRGTMNSGGKEFNDFMHLWNEATKFKSWLKDEPPSKELLKAYIRKISETTWLDKLPSKNIRWLLFTTIGSALGNVVGDATGNLFGGIAGAAVDYFDDFILDRLSHNWKPDQFVEGDYSKFLKSKQNNSL